MKILYSFPHPIGAPGIGTTALQQVLGLLERGHDVTVVATSAHKDAPPLPRLVSTLSVGGVRVPHRALGRDNAMAFHDRYVARFLRQHPGEYDVVHSWPGATLQTAQAATRLGIPSLREVPNTHTENAYEVVAKLCRALAIEQPKGSSHRPNTARLEREKAEYEASFRLLVPSDYVAETFRVRGIPVEKVLRHRYGFDDAAFKPPAAAPVGSFRAVFVGGVGPRKGLHLALEAWARSKASATGRFSIFGRVEDGYLPIIAPYLELPGVELHSFTSDVSRVLQESHVLLLPSYEEGSALVTYEAQGCGVIPLVSEAAGAICEDGVTGLLHQVGDTEALAGHLDRLAEDEALRTQMRAAILERRSALTWAAAAARLEQCYQDAIEAFASDRAPSPGVDRRDVVFTFWRETWTDSALRRFMTPDRLVQALFLHPSVDGLLIADAFRMGAAQLLWRVTGIRRAEPLPARARRSDLVSPLRLRRRDGTGEVSLRAGYRAYDGHLRRAAAKMGLERPAVITTNPLYAAYGDFGWAGPVTYFAFDDWAAYEAHVQWWPDYVRAYAEIRRRGHRVCAVSQHLLDRIAPSGPGLVVPNGIEPEEWRAPWHAPDWLAALPRPYILYTGAIHSRLDLDAVREVAARFPTGSLLFVGPVSHPDVARELQKIPGVHLRDSQPRYVVPGLTRAADVCIMPHLRNALTASMSPLKIYEYCAAGRPAVATDMAPVRGIHPSVVLVQEGGSFADAVELALKNGAMPEDEREAFVRRNSWRGRQDALLEFALAESVGAAALDAGFQEPLVEAPRRASRV